jgi:hypothetical protein
MAKYKKIIDQTKYCDQEEIKRSERTATDRGIANKPILEPIPSYERVGSEVVVPKGVNNSFIILGRDRHRDPSTGYGGRGATQASRIDLIAGMASSYRHNDNTYGPPCEENTLVSPNFAIDAARIYISQKSDIDQYMGLAETPAQNSIGKSSIGLKADEIRIHSRRDVKIVTGRGNFGGLGRHGERLSGGGKNESVGTISFIAGNNIKDKRVRDFDFAKPLRLVKSTVKGLQPIPRGDNLGECLEDIMIAMEELSSMVGDSINLIQQMDLALAVHVHPLAPPIAGPGGSYTITSPVVQAKAASHLLSRNVFNKKLGILKKNYLKITGGRYINSKFVYTT